MWLKVLKLCRCLFEIILDFYNEIVKTASRILWATVYFYLFLKSSLSLVLLYIGLRKGENFGNTSFSVLMDEKEIWANKEVGTIRIEQKQNCRFPKYEIIMKEGNYVSWYSRKTNKNWKSFSLWFKNILNVFQLSWRLKKGATRFEYYGDFYLWKNCVVRTKNITF